MQRHHRKSRQRLPHPQHHQLMLQVHGAQSRRFPREYAILVDIYVICGDIFDGEYDRYCDFDVAQSAVFHGVSGDGEVFDYHDGEYGDMHL